MVFFRKSKAWLYDQFGKLVQAGDSWLAKAPSLSWPLGRRPVRMMGRLAGDFGRLLLDFFRLPAYRAVGQDWTLVYVGSERERLEVERLFYPDQIVEWREIERVYFWQLSRLSRKWVSDEVDLVICEASRILPLARQMAFNLVVPKLIRQIITVPEKAETLVAGERMHAVRKCINRAKRNGFGYRFSRSEADYDHWYHRMYVPYINARHGRRANLAVKDGYLASEFRQGGLLLVVQNDRPVAGQVCRIIGDTFYSVEAGVLDADPSLLDQGISDLIDWYSLQWISGQGAKRIDLGGSRPWCSNGIFRYKAKWRPHVTSFEYAHTAWHIYARHFSPALMNHINQVGFITEIKGEFYRVLVEPEPAALENAEFDKLLRDAVGKGLKGLVVLTPHGNRILTTDLCR